MEAKQSVIENMAPVLTRLFTPLFTVLLLVFLATMAWTGSPIDVEREVLIGFDLLLVLVVGLVLYAASARDPQAPPDFFDGLQLLLVVSALVVDGVALAAIAGRISEFGFTPNRVAALGEKLILRPGTPRRGPLPGSRCGPTRHLGELSLRAMSTLWDEVRGDFPGPRGQVLPERRGHVAHAAPGARGGRPRFYRELETGGDLHWDAWLERREAVRRKVARFVGAEPDEIAFVPNTSTGMNLIADLLEGDGPVLTDELEFPAVTLPWIHRGVPVRFVTAAEGVLRLESFAAGQAPHAATLAISHVQFSNGCRQDLDAFGRIKGSRHFVVCGSQSIGAFPVDVRRSGIDALASAGHKWLCAGYGAGFCYVSRALLAARPPRAVGWMSGEDPFAFDNRHLRVLASNARTRARLPAVRADLRARGRRRVPGRASASRRSPSAC